MNPEISTKKMKGEKKTISPHSYGPVTDLEELVPHDWWRKLFNSYYLRTDSDVVTDEELTANEVDLILKQANLTPEDKILDLCCGQGRHCFEFYRRGFWNIQGLDRSAYLIQKARKESQKQNTPIRFREGDARKLPWKANELNVVTLLGNSFGYFEQENDDSRVLSEIYRVLVPGGKLVLDITDGDFLRSHYEPRSWEWLDKNHFVCRERQLSEDSERLISREVICHTQKGVLKDQFYAERLYAREAMIARLEELGFTCNQAATFRPVSRRNQDLGMMAQRLILVAQAEKEKPALDTLKPYIPKSVQVFLGDPRRTDRIKPAQVFDEDDFDTIRQLRVNLEGLSDFSFSYLDNHETLIEEMMRHRGEQNLVFNLCDEGFENDPFKELHVPALLDMLHIPYTGAEPKCLATCYDKSLVRGAAEQMGIQIPRGVFVEGENHRSTRASFKGRVPLPGIVKPNCGDSSYGIDQFSLIYSEKDLTTVIHQVQERYEYRGPFLVEEFLPGAEITVGIIGNPPGPYMVLPVIQEDYSSLPEGLPAICGYEAKWQSDSPYWKLRSIPADLPEDVHNRLVDDCVRLFGRLGCRDYCRFDWRLNVEGVPHLLEVNPNPGWCWDGHLAKMANLAGLSYQEMLKAILDAAVERMERKYPTAEEPAWDTLHNAV
ncbi:MAG: methyltransferase domain-containing protein [Anaerolineales bacterium]|nr:methyltransferase domain-containing protein [Anaerolineales bacterium]